MKRALFIGNSFTYFNDMPNLFSLIANDAGFDVSVTSVTKGGWYLSRYADPEDEMGKALRAAYPRQKWDYIVLQDQSFNPAADQAGFLRAVHDLRQLMPDGRFVFYQTWAYESDSAKLEGVGYTYEQMRDALREAYQQAALETSGICVPVGDGFSLFRERYPRFSLYQPDSFHPNLTGSYLAACMFLGRLSGKPVTSDLPIKGLDAAHARAALEVVNEVLAYA